MRPLEAVLRRHRLVTIVVLTVLVLLSWTWLLTGAGMGSAAGGPHGMAMPARDVLLVFMMWLMMMMAMMLPSAAPTVLLYTRAEAHRASANAPPPFTAVFLLGYLIVWAAFSALAAALHLALEEIGVLSMATMDLTNRWLSAGVLVAAGVYQLTPLKRACLHNCRSPAEFLARHYRPGPGGALRLGQIHGIYCMGCCWALMLLLFLGGVMNLVWITLLTVLVAAEKLLPWGRQLATVAGTVMLAAGGVLLFA